jgi:hypothetical protein
MKHLKLTLTAVCYMLALGLVSCGGSSKLPYAIEKARNDEFTLTFTQKVKTVKAGEMFDLALMGLEANSKRWTSNFAETPYKFREDKYTYYDVTIAKKGYSTYYGRLAFFNTDDKEKALARYFYTIKVGDKYFAEGKNGKIACIHDANKPTGKKSGKKSIQPTWILWLSDSPF